jgi:hypothetical protein
MTCAAACKAIRGLVSSAQVDFAKEMRGKRIMGNPTIEQARALDGKIFAMLSVEDQNVLDFYRAQGRKFGVSISIINEADPDELAQAASQEQADQIMKRANSRVSVTVAKN